MIFLMLLLGGRTVGAFTVPVAGLSAGGYPSLVFHPFKPRTSQDGGAAVRDVSLLPPAAGPGTMQSRGVLLREPGLNLTAYLLRFGCMAVKTTTDLPLRKDSICGLLSTIAILSSSWLTWLSRRWLFLVVWVPNQSFVRNRTDVMGNHGSRL